MMKALFLGTGAAEGSPRPGHTDRQCLAAMKPGSKTARRRSSIFVDAGRSAILIDAGPDVLLQLADAKIEKLDAVALTHAHGDAAGGLELLDGWSAERGLWLPLYFPAKAEGRIRAKRTSGLDLQPLKDGQAFKVSGTEIASFPVRHGVNYDEPTNGYRIGGLVYASDMEGAPDPSYETMSNAEALVIDGTFWDVQSLRGHYTVDMAIELAQNLNPKSLYLTQIGHRYPPHEEAQALLDARIKEMAAAFPVVIAYDGLRFVVGS